jgi:MEMO1 family protein
MTAETFGIIAPHPPIFMSAVGGAEAREAQASLDALDAARRAIESYDPDTIVLMSPHAPAAADVLLVDGSPRFEGSLAQFRDPTPYSWPGDPEFATALLGELSAKGIDAMPRTGMAQLKAGWLDHATIVPMSFLDPAQHRRLVILSLSYLPLATHRALGRAVRDTAHQLGRRVAFVASGDCSHRLTPEAPAGYSPRGAVFDSWLRETVASGALSALVSVDEGLDEAAGECGLRSFIALGGFAGEDPVPTRVLAYEGPWGVGYLTALVGEAALAAADGSAWPGVQSGSKGGMAGSDNSEIVKLARRAIEAYVEDGTVIEPEPLTGTEYPARAGAFVSLHREGDLRGCIGTIAPTADTLAAEVVHNAIEAATRDPRFPSLHELELSDLDIKVDVLHPPETCDLADLDPANYGVIVSSGWRRGLLLPDLEGVDDVATQVGIAMRKGGITPSERCDIERFKVDRYT